MKERKIIMNSMSKERIDETKKKMIQEKDGESVNGDDLAEECHFSFNIRIWNRSFSSEQS